MMIKSFSQSNNSTGSNSFHQLLVLSTASSTATLVWYFLFGSRCKTNLGKKQRQCNVINYMYQLFVQNRWFSFTKQKWCSGIKAPVVYLSKKQWEPLMGFKPLTERLLVRWATQGTKPPSSWYTSKRTTCINKCVFRTIFCLYLIKALKNSL